MTEAMPTTWEGQTNIYQGTYPERYSDSSFPEDVASEVTVDDWLREDLYLNTYHPEEDDEG